MASFTPETPLIRECPDNLERSGKDGTAPNTFQWPDSSYVIIANVGY